MIATYISKIHFVIVTVGQLMTASYCLKNIKKKLKRECLILSLLSDKTTTTENTQNFWFTQSLYILKIVPENSNLKSKIFNCIYMKMSFSSFSVRRQWSKAKKIQDLENFFRHYSQTEAKNRKEQKRKETGSNEEEGKVQIR